MLRRLLCRVTAAVTVGTLVACGGSTPPPVSEPPAPPSEPTNMVAASTTQSAEAPEPSAEPSAVAPPPELTTAPPPVEAAPEQKKPTQLLSDYLFAPTLAFMFNDSGSDLREAIKKGCEKKSSPDDLAAQAECREKERSKFVADVLVFQKKGGGLQLTIYKRSGSSLAETAQSKLKIAEDTPERIRLTVLSEKGTRTLFANKKEIVVGRPSESGLEITDPVLGKLVYEGRIGLVDQSSGSD